jgi:hypothetical protein
MGIRDIQTVDSTTDEETTHLFAAALDAWAEQLDDYPTEFSLMGLKLFENTNGFYPKDGDAARQFLIDLNDFCLAWPTNDDLTAAEAEVLHVGN